MAILVGRLLGRGKGVARSDVKEQAGAGEKITFWVIALIIAYLVVPPLIYMLWTSLTPGGRYGLPGTFSFNAYVKVLTSRGFAELLGTTFFFTFASTVLGIGCGGIMAWLVQRTNTPWKFLGYGATFIGFAVPGMLRTIGWILLFGPNGIANRALAQMFGEGTVHFNVLSLAGMIFIEATLWTPIAFMMLVGPFRAMDPSLEEAASLSGASPLTVIRRITARLLLPGMLSVALLMTMRVLQAFEVPLVVGVPAGVSVLTSRIYERIHRSVAPDYAEASAYGALLVLLLSLVLLLYYRMTREAARFQTVTGKGYRPRTMDLRSWRWLGVAFLIFMVVVQAAPVVYLLFSSFLPSLAVQGPFWQHLTLQNYTNLGNFPGIFQSVTNSLVIAFVSATVAVLIAAVTAWMVVRSRLGYRWSLELLLGFPLVYPGIIMSLAVLVVYLRVPIPVYGTIWVLVLAYLATFTPFAMRYVHPALLQIHRELEESAYISGAGPVRTFFRIMVPLLMPALNSAWIFIFFIAVRELSVAVLLYTAQSQVVATQILDMWTNGNITQLTAFGSVVAVGSVLVGIVVLRFTQRFGVQ